MPSGVRFGGQGEGGRGPVKVRDGYGGKWAGRGLVIGGGAHFPIQCAAGRSFRR